MVRKFNLGLSSPGVAGALLVLVGFGLSAAAEVLPMGEAGRGREAVEELARLLTQAENAYRNLEAYEVILHKQQRVGGRLLPKETILLKFRRPFSVAMGWVEEPFRGRRALYVDGKNGNRLRVREKTPLGPLTLDLAPKSRMAMRGNRRPITEAGLGPMLDILREQFEAAHTLEGFRVAFQHDETVFGRPAVTAVVSLPDRFAPEFRTLVLHLDRERSLPVRVSLFDESNRLVEQYGYENLNEHPELSERDFDFGSVGVDP